MAKSVKGYRELKSEVEMARNRMKEVEMLKEKVDKTIQTSFYKSPVGTRYTINFIMVIEYINIKSKKIILSHKNPILTLSFLSDNIMYWF